MTNKDFDVCKNILWMKYDKKVKNDSLDKKEFNIEQFSKLDRKGLTFQQKERRLLLHTTKDKEKIFIQYPGKESISPNDEKIRPWDFKPKLLLVNGTYIKDLSFPDIWDDLTNIHASGKTLLSILASIFFRMAVMYEYNLTEEDCYYEDIDSAGNVINKGTIRFKYYKPVFSDMVLNYLSSIKPRGVSLEAYLIYNDLLVQNEDCKYYYRDVKVNKQKWNDNSGRYNTLLSHISVIEYLQKKLSFSQIMRRFQSGKGVAPVLLKEVPDITQDIILYGAQKK